MLSPPLLSRLWLVGVEEYTGLAFGPLSFIAKKVKQPIKNEVCSLSFVIVDGSIFVPIGVRRIMEKNMETTTMGLYRV